MRTIEWSNQFKKDFKREQKGRYREVVGDDLFTVISMLANDEVLPKKYRDHALVGNWASFRDCHIKPDLILIYRKVNEVALQLARLGSHSELDL